MSTFTSIPVRANGDDILAGWFNQLRTAGVDLSTAVAVIISETTFSLTNNQTSFADVTGLLISPTLYQSAEIYITVKRRTTGGGATSIYEFSKYFAVYDANSSTWEFAPIGQVGDAGMTFQITAAGQVQYKTTNITGTPSISKMSFKATAMGIIT